MQMANKSIAKQLNVQILVLVLKSLQDSRHDLKVVSKFASIKCQSEKTEDEILMNVEFSGFNCISFFFYFIFYIFSFLFFNFFNIFIGI